MWSALCTSQNLRRSALWLAKRKPLAFGRPKCKKRAFGVVHLPMVIPEVKLVQVLLQIAASPMMIRAKHATFDQPEESFDCVRSDVTPILVARILAFLVGHNIVIGKFVVDEVVDGCFVRLDRGAHFNVLFHYGFDVVQGDALDREGSDAAPVVAALHKRNHGPFLALNPRYARLAAFSRANPNFVDFDNSAQLFNHAVLCHGEAEPMHHEPNRLVADSGHAVNLVSAHSLLAGAEQIRSKKPAVQGNVGILEDSSDSNAELLTAPVALPDTFTDGLLGTGAGFQFAGVVDFSAVGADRTIGPADGFVKLASALRSGVRLTPRSGLAPTPAETEAGAMSSNDYRLGWWLNRDLYGLTVSKCDLDSNNHADSILPESPVPAGLSHLTPKSFLAALGFKLLRKARLRRARSFRACQIGRNRQSTYCVSQGVHAPSLVYPHVGSAHASRLHDFRNFFDLARLFHSPDCGMDGSQKIVLRRQSESLNPVAHFSREKRSFCCSKYNPASVSNPLHESRESGTSFIRLYQFMQGCNPLFLFCNFYFEFFSLGRHEDKLVDRVFKIGFVIPSHRSI
jgi:hypothetical protein